MADQQFLGLDNAAFRDRVKRFDNHEPKTAAQVVTPAQRPSTKYYNGDIIVARPQKTEAVQPQAAPVISQPPKIESPQAPKPVSSPPAIDLSTLPLDELSESKPRRKQKTGNKSSKIVMSMAVMIFLIGFFVSAQTFKVNISAKSKANALANQTSSDDSQPDESSAGDISSYKVAPDKPKFIKIASLKINARIKSMDVTKNNALQAPQNIYDAGWYSSSAKPGDPGSNGAILIDGHVHGPTKPGVFAQIKTLKSGETITIQRGDDKTFTYKVVKVQNFDSKSLDLGIALASVQPGLPGLNLITCGGKFDTKTDQYTERTIVFAVLQS